MRWNDEEKEFQGDKDEEISSKISDLFSTLSFEEQIELFDGGNIDEKEEPEDTDVSDDDELSDEDDQDSEEYDTIEEPYYDVGVQEKIEEVKEEESLNYDDDQENVVAEVNQEESIELLLSQIESLDIYEFVNSFCGLGRAAGRVLFIGYFFIFISSSCLLLTTNDVHIFRGIGAQYCYQSREVQLSGIGSELTDNFDEKYIAGARRAFCNERQQHRRYRQ
ncbi:MAG: hypothetical protein EZS28_000163 [Streblomastix strix]|uniref:Uncharacterized protein n=1 Tax=Streblomastix strix TaxID=222440 RepID=A0A5J4XAH3_9EUKA|nr:MAG: hypothetical protein EZS28_000163 [Streblomastix strix]